MKMTKEMILKAIGEGAKSLSQIGKSLGVKGNISGSMTKKMRVLVPDISDRLAGKVKDAPKTPIVQTAPTVHTPKKEKVEVPSMKDKAAALARLASTGNPFKAGSMKAIVFEIGSKAFRPLKDILTEAANDPRFVALCPKGEKLGDSEGGRYKRAYWQYTMIRGAHPGNHGVTDWESVEGETRLKGHDRVVKAVVKT
jgi:hypothetical protein